MNTAKPKITLELIEEAKQKPNEWISQMDLGVKKPGHYVYPETIIGYWYVDKLGNITDRYKSNPDYIPYKMAERAPREYMMRSLPDNTNAEEWCVEVDPEYDHLFPNFPQEGIIGDWFIGKDGFYTGHFRPNPKYMGNIKT